MNDPKIKKQIVDKIKESSNILVTVSKDPSVDELSAALGLTLLINKMEKHGTAIFSGKIPPAITFLDPERTFESTTDSLRDFIIALDKEKADHLRYKLEGDFVKIYITPYRSTITSDDLTFDQGDYNVELVIALGVENKDNLDEALAGHGRILHDATVVTLTAGDQSSNLGSLDWHDDKASSLGEMLVTLYDALGTDKKLLDQSIATAFLTGIVAATERFSNTKTTSSVMTVAAQLMAAGADQQLIATQLEAEHDEHPLQDEPTHQDDTPEDAPHDDNISHSDEPAVEPEQAPEEPKKDGELSISHDRDGSLDKIAQEVAKERLEESAAATQRAIEKQEELRGTEDHDAAAPRGGAVAYTPSPAATVPEKLEGEPTFSSALSATADQAEADKKREIARDKNKVILSHNNYVGDPQGQDGAENVNSLDGVDTDSNKQSSALEDAAAFEPETAPTVEAQTILPPSQKETVIQPLQTAEALQQPQAPQTLAELDAENRTPVAPDNHDAARADVMAAFEASPETSGSVTEPATPIVPDTMALPPLPPPPPMPDFNDFSALPPLPPLPSTPQPEILGDILSNEQPVPSTEQQLYEPVAPITPVASEASSTDPGQFRIPGQ